MEFKDQVVIVTGGAQGIGRAISQEFAKSGAVVVIADIDEEAGIESLEYINNKLNARAIYLKTDVSKERDIIHLVNTTMKQYGKINIVVNNAGINHVESIYTMKIEDFDKVIHTNLRSVFMLSKYAAMEMKKVGRGSIINIASTRATMSEPNTESYAASKGGIVSITHALAISLGNDGIRVNAISPGWIEVGDWQKSSHKRRPVHSKEDNEQHPVGRVGHPLDIAQACLYLASDHAGFITGQNFIIDGGMTRKMIYMD